MKILIIEDEPRAANQLQRMLSECNFQYELSDIIESVEDTVIWFQNKNTCDLIFMDIQLADGLSFEIFQKVQVDIPIIFTTAFDQYAIQAFKVNSVDYLLKPIHKADLENALDKFGKSKTPVVDATILTQLMQSMHPTPTQIRQSILVKEGGGFITLNIPDILYVYSEDSITFGVTATNRYIIDETVDKLYNSLDQGSFFRISRSQIVSRKAIQKIEPYFNHRVKLKIANPRNQDFIVSRPKTSEFKVWANS